MKALVISKPMYEYILPLVEFPQDGDNFFINNSIETINNSGILSSIILSKYGIETSYTGMIGEDEEGKKVNELLNSYNVNTDYIEISYNERTEKSYKIYNQKSNKFTSINEKSLKTTLTKYKYDFYPEVIIMDNGDYGANLAAINNFSDAKKIYIADKFTKDSVVYCNKCDYIIAPLAFGVDCTGVTVDLGKTKTIIQMFQKFIDIHSANLIIRLNNFDFLYCVDDEVRLIKNINKNITNKENLYNAILIYSLINTKNIENSIKITNKVMLESGNDIDMIKNIPDFNVVNEIINNMPKEIIENKPIVNTETINNINNDINNSQINTNNNVINEDNNVVIEKPKIATEKIEMGIEKSEKL